MENTKGLGDVEIGQANSNIHSLGSGYDAVDEGDGGNPAIILRLSYKERVLKLVIISQ